VEGHCDRTRFRSRRLGTARLSVPHRSRACTGSAAPRIKLKRAKKEKEKKARTSTLTLRFERLLGAYLFRCRYMRSDETHSGWKTSTSTPPPPPRKKKAKQNKPSTTAPNASSGGAGEGEGEGEGEGGGEKSSVASHAPAVRNRHSREAQCRLCSCRRRWVCQQKPESPHPSAACPVSSWVARSAMRQEPRLNLNLRVRVHVLEVHWAREPKE
jgi:hypothetical protein